MLATKASRSITADAVRGSMAGHHPVRDSREARSDASSPITSAQCRASSCGGSGPGSRAAAIAWTEAPSTAAVAGADSRPPARRRTGHRARPRSRPARSRPVRAPPPRPVSVARCRHQLARPLEQHGRTGALGPGPDRADRVGGHLAALATQQPGQLPGVRGQQDRVRAVGPAGGADRRRRSRPAARSRSRRRSPSPAVGPVAPAGPEQPGLHPTLGEDDVGQLAGGSISAGVGAAGSGPCPLRRRRHRGWTARRPPGSWSEPVSTPTTPRAYLSLVGRPGTGQRAATSSASQAASAGGVRSGRVRCRPARSSRTGSRPARSGGRACRLPNVTVRRRPDRAARVPLRCRPPPRTAGRPRRSGSVRCPAAAATRAATGSGSPGRPPMPSTPSIDQVEPPASVD